MQPSERAPHPERNSCEPEARSELLTPNPHCLGEDRITVVADAAPLSSHSLYILVQDTPSQLLTPLMSMAMSSSAAFSLSLRLFWTMVMSLTRLLGQHPTMTCETLEIPINLPLFFPFHVEPGWLEGFLLEVIQFNKDLGGRNTGRHRYCIS